MPRRSPAPSTTVRDVVIRWAKRTADIETLDDLAQWLIDAVYQAHRGEREAVQDQDYGRANGWQSRRQTLEEIQILVNRIRGPVRPRITLENSDG